MVVRIRKFVIPLVLAVLAVIGCFAVHAGVQHFTGKIILYIIGTRF